MESKAAVEAYLFLSNESDTDAVVERQFKMKKNEQDRPEQEKWWIGE
jgi:hypothetical protein